MLARVVASAALGVAEESCPTEGGLRLSQQFSPTREALLPHSTKEKEQRERLRER